MKTLDVSDELPSVRELLEMASDENVILRTFEGREFILAEIDDFDRELEPIRQNDELMEFLRLRSSEDKSSPLARSGKNWACRKQQALFLNPLL